MKPLLTNTITVKIIENASTALALDHRLYPSWDMSIDKSGGLRHQTLYGCLTCENMGGDETRRC